MDCSPQHSHAKLTVADLYKATIQLYCKGWEKKAFASRFDYECLSCFFLAGDTKSPEKIILGRIALSQQNESLQTEVKSLLFSTKQFR